MQQTTPTVRSMIRETGTLMLLFGIACIPSIGQAIALSIVIWMLFGKPSTTFKCLVAGATVTLITLSSYKLSSGSLFSVRPKWILLFAACARSLVAEGRPTKVYGDLIKYWGLITGVLIINALFVSAIPTISGFKTISFSLGLLCMIRLGMLTREQNSEMLLFISEMGTAVVLLSLPLLPFEVGCAQFSGAYFNGIFYHPQALGVFLAITGAASFAAAFKLPQIERELIMCGLAQWSMIYFTRCRTALVAVMLGGIVYIIEILVRGGKSSRIRFISASTITLTASGLLVATMIFPQIREGVSTFVSKGDVQTFANAGDRTAAISMGSRSAQIINDLDITEAHPVFGYGFGVEPGSESYLDPNAVTLWGIPLQAPIEQGFLPLATVAQIGIVGALFILPFLISMYRRARRGSAETAGVFIVVLGVNFGEMIFFSFGSMGGLVWAMLILLTVSGSMYGSSPEH
jgi:hypothetical protein